MSSVPVYRDPPSQTEPVPLRNEQCAYCRERNKFSIASDTIVRCDACGFVLPQPKTHKPIYATDLEHDLISVGAVLRGRYRLIELLGQGTQGLTFLAHHEFLNHPCVVKVLPHRIADARQDSARQLRAEASAGFRVNHPNVVRVLDGDTVDGLWFFVMEFIDGVDLSEATNQRIRIDWRQATRLLRDAARGLAAIHRAGLVHRDIKPGNLILGNDGRARIADLGVAGLVSKQNEYVASVQGTRTGTLAYAAPEVLDTSSRADCRSDLYSLGATVYELVTGGLPRGASIYRNFLSSDQKERKWPEERAGDEPKWLIKAILKLLAPEPDQRFESAAALIQYLEQPGKRLARRPERQPSDYPEPGGLVVLPFENATETSSDDWLGHALADHLTRSLARLDEVYVADIDQFLPTLKRLERHDGESQGERLLRAGRLSGAATVIEGSFTRRGDKLELDARIYQTTKPAPTMIGPLSDELSMLAELENELLERIIKLLELNQDRVAAARKPRGDRKLAAEERFFTAKRAFLRGDYETAKRLGEEAVAIDPGHGDALGIVGACCARIGKYDEAVEFNQRQQELARNQGDQWLKVQADANLGSMHYFRGEYEAANECMLRAARLAEQQGLAADLAHIRNNQGFVLLQMGRPTQAEETFLRAIETLKRYGALVALVGPYNGLGHVMREQKRYEEAREYFRRALVLAQESEDNVNAGVAYMNLGHCALLQGCLADAKHELAVALNILEKTSFWNGLARVYEYMADLNLRLTNCAEAMRCAQQRIELARRHANARMEAAAWRQKSEALKLMGRMAEAQTCMSRGCDGERSMRNAK